MPAQPLVTALADCRDALAATTQPFSTARTPPGRLFYDSTVYRHDLEALFGNIWLCAGHAARVAEPGSFFRIEVGDDSLLIVRDRDRQLGAFFNVCRHRGTRLTTRRAGECGGFTCPYHAWHYDLDGSLKAAPMMDDVAGFKLADYSLAAAHVDEFMGFVFVHLGGNPPPLADQFGDFPDLARFRLADLVSVAEHRYDVHTNWKLVCQNYHECYHCPVAHPDLHRVSHHDPQISADVSGRLFIGGPMALRDGFSTLTKSGQSTRRPLPGATPDDLRTVHYFNLLPNFLLSIAPDYVLTHHVWPRGPERVSIESHWLFAKAEADAPNFDPTDVVDFWDSTNRQDWALCENALVGLKSTRHQPGPYQTSEDCAHRFDRWYAQQLLDTLG